MKTDKSVSASGGKDVTGDVAKDGRSNFIKAIIARDFETNKLKKNQILQGGAQ